MLYIFIPKNIKTIILKNKYLYIYNNIFFLTFKLPNLYFYNKFLNVLKISIKKKLKKNFITNFLFLWNNFIFMKFYFLGKGFKLKKIEKNLIFNFNHSHINLIINNITIIKKIQKSTILIFSKNVNNLKTISKIILNIKKINVFTKRGLRKNKQIIYIKKNKNNT